MQPKLISSFILIFAISLFAQPQRPRYGLEQFDLYEMVKHLSVELELTDEQVEKIEPILLQTQVKLNELKEKSYNSNQEMMEEHRAMMDENAMLIEEHLTVDQVEIFREMRSQTPRMLKKDRQMRGKRFN